ncbi:MAG TPA: RNA polymerase sigma factor [Pseudomonas sp.]|uniref:RNA polymerase sigma factor n=1 Tax=Pseudomonas sp. TaxID=306 RepID=UPI002EDAC272
MSQLPLNELFVAQRTILLRTLQRIVNHPSTAEDLLHETWLRVDRVLKDRNIDHLEPFVFQTARNLALDHLRANRNRARTVVDNIPSAHLHNISACSTSLDDAIHAVRLVDHLNRNIASLSPRQQRIFSLSRLHGCSYLEIAKQLDVSVSTVQKELKLIMAICVGVAERLNDS